MLTVLGPGLSSIVLLTLSNPVAVTWMRLLPGSSLSSESGVMPTNCRSMNTDAPGTSVSSFSDASVGAAGAVGAGGGSGFFGAAPLRVAIVATDGAIGVGGSTFLGITLGALGASGAVAAGVPGAPAYRPR